MIVPNLEKLLGAKLKELKYGTTKPDKNYYGINMRKLKMTLLYLQINLTKTRC